MSDDRRPRITVMGEEVAWDEYPVAQRAVELDDYFKPVKLAPKAVDSASRMVPRDIWLVHGLHTWLQERANHVFSKLPSGKMEGQFGKLRYFFDFDSDGPVLRNVSL